MAKDKDRNVIIVDRSAPRVAIQITEIAVDAKKKTRRRQSVAHLTVTNLSGEEAKRIIIKAIEKVSRSVDEELLANSPSSQEICRPIRYPSVHGRDKRQVRPTRKSAAPTGRLRSIAHARPGHCPTLDGYCEISGDLSGTKPVEDQTRAGCGVYSDTGCVKKYSTDLERLHEP